MHLATLVQRRNRFRTHQLTTASCYLFVADVLIYSTQRKLYQITAIVALANNTVRSKFMIRRNHRLRPLKRRTL